MFFRRGFRVFFYIFLNCSHIYPPVCTCRKWKLEEMVSAFHRYLQTPQLLTIATSKDQKPRPSRGQKKQFLPWNMDSFAATLFTGRFINTQKYFVRGFKIPKPNSKHSRNGWDSFWRFWLGLNRLPGSCVPYKVSICENV